MPLAILPIAAALLVLSVAASWDVTFGPLLRGLAEQIRQAPIGGRLRSVLGLTALASAIVSFEQAFRRRIGEAVGAMGAPLAAVFLAARHALVWPARQSVSLARDVGDALWGLRTVVIPAMIAAKVGWIPRHLAALAAKIATIPRVVSHTATHTVTRVIPHYTTTIVQKAVAVPLPRLGRLEREAGSLGKRIDKLARRVAPAAIASAVVVALSRTSLRWFRCSNVNRAARQVCRTDPRVLDDLLAGLVLVGGTVSLVQFAEQLQETIEGTAEAVHKFWRV